MEEAVRAGDLLVGNRNRQPYGLRQRLNIGGLVLCVDADSQRLSPGGGECALLPSELVEERTRRWRPRGPEQEGEGVTRVRRKRLLLAAHVSQREVGRRIALVQPRRTAERRRFRRSRCRAS